MLGHFFCLWLYNENEHGIKFALLIVFAWSIHKYTKIHVKGNRFN